MAQLKVDDIIKVSYALREAKNNLIMAAMILDQSEYFDTTVSEIKKTIGDLECSIGHLNTFNRITREGINEK